MHSCKICGYKIVIKSKRCDGCENKNELYNCDICDDKKFIYTKECNKCNCCTAYEVCNGKKIISK